MNKTELIHALHNLDEEAALLFDDENLRFSIVIVGGSSLVILGYSLRATHDIDVLSAPKKLLPLLGKYGLNTSVVAYTDSFPYGYEERLQRLPINGRIIDYFAPSLEDLVVSKLYAMRPPDIEDLENPDVIASINWVLLDDLIIKEDEAPASALNERRYKEMLDAYMWFKEKYQ
ncbi:MAG: DUF6036 family nucleotidyltransferase [Coriobacteriia bacterium]|nr:DUF6036 family nucleotidyltransferase [Coriobacteriia bacterium]